MILFFGIMLGASLTYTVTFHLWWCTAMRDGALGPGMLSGRSSSPFMGPGMLPPGMGVLPKERCVCGEELRALESAKDVTSVDPSKDSSIGDARPESLQAKKLTNLTKPQPALEGVVVNVMVSVLSPQGRPEWVESVFETWGKEAGQLLIFVEEKNFDHSDPQVGGLPVVPVPPSDPSDLQRNSMLQAVLRYLIQHRLDGNMWFLLAPDDSYVRLPELAGFLSRLDPSQLHYVGRWATGRATDAAKLGLMPHEKYCLGSSGIVLSSALLHKLGKSLTQCWGDTGEIPDDVALGKCISRNLDIQCSQDETVSSYQVVVSGVCELFCCRTLWTLHSTGICILWVFGSLACGYSR